MYPRSFLCEEAKIKQRAFLKKSSVLFWSAQFQIDQASAKKVRSTAQFLLFVSCPNVRVRFAGRKLARVLFKMF